MLRINNDLEGALKHYLHLLEKEAYFEAHEVLEEAWHPLRLREDPLGLLVKGLINGAITFEHLKRNKKNAHTKAQRVIVSYHRHRHLLNAQTTHAELFGKAISKIENLKTKHAEVFDVLVS